MVRCARERLEPWPQARSRRQPILRGIAFGDAPQDEGCRRSAVPILPVPPAWAYERACRVRLMRPILLTGFEPYGGMAGNPALDVMRVLDGTLIGGRAVAGRALPVSMARLNS